MGSRHKSFQFLKIFTRHGTRGFDQVSGKSVLINRIVARTQRLNEYDVTDTLFLTDWLHAHWIAVIKLKMAEHKIDQEIDFTVQRESRQAALNQGQQSVENRPSRSLLRRIS
jgi:hypothetical protein